MKNTRRFLAAVMALAMISAIAPISASARGGEGEPAGTSLTENGASADTNVKYSVDPSYTVVIPADVTLSDTEDETVYISLDETTKPFKLNKDKQLSVKIADVGTNNFKVTNEDDTIDYTVKAGTTTLAKGDTAAEFSADNKTAKPLTFPKLDPTKAKYAGEYTGTLTFTIAVEAAPTTVDVESISLDKPTLGLTAGGDPATLTATVSPDDATDKTVTWTSNNTSVATVSNGVVTPVAAGTATITATAGDKSATCTVTVTVKKIITWDTIISNHGIYAEVSPDGIENMGINSDQGISVACVSGSQPGDGFVGDMINIHSNGASFEFVSTVGNISQIVITANDIMAYGLSSGWTASDSTLTWSGTASDSVTLSAEMLDVYGISKIEFTVE